MGKRKSAKPWRGNVGTTATMDAGASTGPVTVSDFKAAWDQNQCQAAMLSMNVSGPPNKVKMWLGTTPPATPARPSTPAATTQMSVETLGTPEPSAGSA